jgi:hypothetical protein
MLWRYGQPFLVTTILGLEAPHFVIFSSLQRPVTHPLHARCPRICGPVATDNPRRPVLRLPIRSEEVAIGRGGGAGNTSAAVCGGSCN